MKILFLVFCLMISALSLAANYEMAEVTATSTSTVVAAFDFNRCALTIQNKGSVDVYVKPDSAHSGTEGIQIVPGGSWEPFEAPSNVLYMKTSTGTSLVVLIKGKC